MGNVAVATGASDFAIQAVRDDRVEILQMQLRLALPPDREDP